MIFLPIRTFSSVFGIVSLIFLAMSLSPAQAQNEAAIGSNTTKSNAILWLKGNGKQGLILPIVTNRNAVENPDKGMIVFDDADGKVYFRADGLWVEVGSGGSSTSGLRLEMNGNNIRLFAGAVELSAIPLAGGTSGNGSMLVFDGGAWKFGTLSGDASGTVNAIQVGGIKGKSIASLPATPQALVYDPAANSGAGGWTFQTLNTGSETTPKLSNGQILIGNGTTNSAVTLTGDATLSGGALTLNPISGGAAGKITDNTITNDDISTNAAIAVNKLAAGTNGQVLTTTGGVPVWSNAAAGTVTSVTAGTGLTGGTITGTGTIGVDVGTTASKIVQLDANAKLPGVDGSALTNLNAGNISTGTLSLGRLAVGTNGQVLTTNGGVATWANASAGTVTSVTAGTGLTGGTIISTGTIGVDVGTTANKIVQLDANAKLPAVDGSALTNLNAVNIGGNIPLTKLAQSSATNGQVLKWNGSAWTPAVDNAGSGIILSSGQIVIGDGTANSAAILSGDATLDGATLKLNPISGGTGGKITDNTITDADISTTALINVGKLSRGQSGQVLTTNGTDVVWSPAATGTVKGITAGIGLLGGAITDSGTIDVNVGNGPGQIVQLDPSGNLPALNGAALTDLDADKITSGTFPLARLGQGNATIGQTLKWNGSRWLPSDVDIGSIVPILGSGQILAGNGTANSAVTLTGDAELSGSQLLIKPISGGTAGKIEDGTITDADISASAAIAGSKIDPQFGPQDISASGKVTFLSSLQVGSNGQFGLNATGNIIRLNNLPVSFPSTQGQANSVLTNDGSGNLTWTAPSSGGWGLNGNANADANSFLGTTTDAPLRFKVNNVRAGLISATTNATFFGYEAGAANSDNAATGFGFQALTANTTGIGNTAMGRYALAGNTTGQFNTAIGNSSMTANTTGSFSTALGAATLQFSTGDGNTALGSQALQQNRAAEYNTAIGYRALNTNQTGSNSTAIGAYALLMATSSSNTAIGFASQAETSTGFQNVSIGNNSLYLNSTGSYNVAIGNLSMYKGASTDFNTAIGYASLSNNETASSNTAVGVSTLNSLASGQSNTAVGENAMSQLTGGTKNTAVGSSAMFVGTGNYNTVLGANADVGVGLTNATAIGYQANASVSNSLVLGGINENAVKVGIGTTAPTASLEVNGYSKLGGSDAPAIKMAKLTGTTSATAGGTSEISLGNIPASKILAIDVMVEYANGSYMPPRYNGSGSLFEYTWYSDTSKIVVLLDAAAQNMLAKKIKVLVTYEQ